MTSRIEQVWGRGCRDATSYAARNPGMIRRFVINDAIDAFVDAGFGPFSVHDPDDVKSLARWVTMWLDHAEGRPCRWCAER